LFDLPVYFFASGLKSTYFFVHIFGESLCNNYRLLKLFTKYAHNYHDRKTTFIFKNFHWKLHITRNVWPNYFIKRSIKQG